MSSTDSITPEDSFAGTRVAILRERPIPPAPWGGVGGLSELLGATDGRPLRRAVPRARSIRGALVLVHPAQLEGVLRDRDRVAHLQRLVSRHPHRVHEHPVAGPGVLQPQRTV